MDVVKSDQPFLFWARFYPYAVLGKREKKTLCWHFKKEMLTASQHGCS